MYQGDVWVVGHVREWSLDSGGWSDFGECYICNACKNVNKSMVYACPRCGTTMVGIVRRGDNNSYRMDPIEDAVLQLGEDEIRIE